MNRKSVPEQGAFGKTGILARLKVCVGGKIRRTAQLIAAANLKYVDSEISEKPSNPDNTSFVATLPAGTELELVFVRAESGDPAYVVGRISGYELEKPPFEAALLLAEQHPDFVLKHSEIVFPKKYCVTKRNNFGRVLMLTGDPRGMCAGVQLYLHYMDMKFDPACIVCGVAVPKPSNQPTPPPIPVLPPLVRSNFSE